MLRKTRARMTYANVVSSLCLFLVVSGGTALAAATITGADIVDESITSVDIAKNTLTGAQIAHESITGLDIDDNTIGGTRILDGSVTSADIENGSVSATDIRASESWRVVGAYAGATPFTNYSCDCRWNNADTSTPVGFYKDPLGIVRLRGAACWGYNDSGYDACRTSEPTSSYRTVFTLPPGYRPGQIMRFINPRGYVDPPAETMSKEMPGILIASDGRVTVTANNNGRAGLDGIQFRAAG